MQVLTGLVTTIWYLRCRAVERYEAAAVTNHSIDVVSRLVCSTLDGSVVGDPGMGSSNQTLCIIVMGMQKVITL